MLDIKLLFKVSHGSLVIANKTKVNEIFTYLLHEAESFLRS